MIFRANITEFLTSAVYCIIYTYYTRQYKCNFIITDNTWGRDKGLTKLKASKLDKVISFQGLYLPSVLCCGLFQGLYFSVLWYVLLRTRLKDREDECKDKINGHYIPVNAQ